MMRAVLRLMLCLSLPICGGCASSIARRLLQPPVFPELEQQREQEARQVARQWRGHLHVFTYRGAGNLRLDAVSLDPVGKPKGTIILLHGLGDQKEGMLEFAEAFAKAGYRAVAPDLRAQGDSGGRYTTFGYYEKWDCVALLDAIAARGHKVNRVGVIGGSLGAAVALQWAAVDPRVKTVVALAPFADLATEARYLLHRHFSSMSSKRLGEITRAAERLGQFQIAQVSPLKSIRRLDIPVYLVHGQKDRVIPVQASRQLFQAANGPVVLQMLPDAGHMDLVGKLGESFLNRALQWFDTYAAGARNRAPEWVWTMPHRHFPRGRTRLPGVREFAPAFNDPPVFKTGASRRTPDPPRRSLAQSLCQ